MKKFASLFGVLMISLAACGAVEEHEPDPTDPTTEVDRVDETDPTNDTPDPADEELAVAPFDNDSLQNPAVEQFMSPTGTRVLTVDGDISDPEGDTDDWVEFRVPANSNSSQPVWLTLDCSIDGHASDRARVTLYEDGVQTTRGALCNDGEVSLTIDNTKTQTLRVHFNSVADAAYMNYTLVVKAYR